MANVFLDLPNGWECEDNKNSSFTSLLLKK